MSFCDKNKRYVDKPEWFDPLGPNANGENAPTGGPEARSRIFDYLQSKAPGLNGQASQLSTRLARAANDPGFGSAASLARKSMNGDYLNGSPQIDRSLASMRQAAAAQTADQSADIRGAYARAGQSFSTANQQSEQSANAASAARANELESQVRLANYQAERQNQIGAGGQLASALGTPLDYLGQRSNAELAPSTQISQIVQGLSGNGQIATPNSTIVNQKGWGGQAISAAAGAAGMAGY